MVDVDRDCFEGIGSIAGKIAGGLAKDRKWDGKPITEPGVYSGIDIEQYHHNTDLFGGAWSISSSGLRTILRRPLEWWYGSPFNPDREEPEGSKALNFGKAAHMLLLGEEGFSEIYSLRPATIDGKPWQANRTVCREWIAAQAEAGRTVITETEIGHIRKIAAALSRNDVIRLGLLNGRIERSMFAKDGDIWLRARPDVIPNASGDFVDLKTAASVDDESLSKAIYQHGYHIQAGFIRMVARAVLGTDAFTSFTFVFVEKTAPYDVRVKQLKDCDIDMGEKQAMRGLEIMRRCIETGHWPGYDDGNPATWIEMPAWSRTRIENQLNVGEAA